MQESLTIILLFIAGATLFGFIIQLLTWLIEKKK